MSNDITNFNGGSIDLPLSTVLYNLAKREEIREKELSLIQNECKELKDKLQEHEEYGVLPSKVRVDGEPSDILSTPNIVKQVNEYRLINFLRGTICKYDVNKRAEELGMVIMEGNYIKSVCEIYSKKIIIHSKTIAYFSNDCYKRIVDSFKPDSRFKF